MATVVTQHSDPILWAALNSSYISQGHPRDVVRGTDTYEVFTTTVEEVCFKLVNPIDYIDSRSLTRSKPATYNNLRE